MHRRMVVVAPSNTPRRRGPSSKHGARKKKSSSASPATERGLPPNPWFKTIPVPPFAEGGRLGLTVQFSNQYVGALVKKIDPKFCNFADRICLGDRIVTSDGRQVNCARDLKEGSDRTRHFGVVPAAAAAAPDRPIAKKRKMSGDGRPLASSARVKDASIDSFLRGRAVLSTSPAADPLIIDAFLRGRGCLESKAGDSAASAAYYDVLVDEPSSERVSSKAAGGGSSVIDNFLRGRGCLEA